NRSPTLSSIDQKKRTKKRPTAASSLLEPISSPTDQDITMSTADALDPFNDLATTGATSSGVPDFVKKLYRQVIPTKKK
ncbi:hypothetical protein BGX30_003683, partial [Mortierella sp. GBA39]